MVQPHFAKNRLFMEIEVVEASCRTAQLVAVYEHWGFRPYQRTEFDDQRNPFPIIKMRLLR